ncbi:hypothetical protein SAMN04488511_12110 [Pedobacter suwonensis]|uniref:Uncharacterized protein n=1 Tax=Pedobacter suwonensis TaxID=332999 RepID=A0A1I0U508_9SPHI|nr:hypothetical protein [Pedobacter suwonensis]SFA59088.1 hypothetical protein SAMN04488511_12110 [Pedobacter suwonensis]
MLNLVYSLFLFFLGYFVVSIHPVLPFQFDYKISLNRKFALAGQIHHFCFQKSSDSISLALLVLCSAHTPAGLMHQAGIRCAKVYVMEFVLLLGV